MLSNFLKNEKVYVFIDAENLFYSQKTLGWLISYEKLMKYFKEECGENTKVFVYTGVDEYSSSQQKFIDLMVAKGFIVRTKAVKKIKDESGITKWKSNLDIEMALEIIELSEKFKVAVLVSGDSDFAPVVDKLKKKSKRVFVISTRGHIARELLERAKYIELKKLKNRLSK